MNNSEESNMIKVPEKRIFVITNDSTVFQTDKWVSAFEMFGGRVTEVKNLVTDLCGEADVSMGIISGRFGFIPANYVVMPYPWVPESKEDFELLQSKRDFLGAIKKTLGIKVGDTYLYDKVIVCVPKVLFEMMKDVLPDDRVIAITNPQFEEECRNRGWSYYKRGGSRVGKKNAADIIKEIEGWNAGA
jgi:hypothetical protein